MIKEYPKGSDIELTSNFKAKSFDCKCKSEACTKTLIDDSLIDKLQQMRNILGTPLVVESGYRCRPYQLELSKAGYQTARGVSPHEQGKAADIHTLGKHSGVELEEIARDVGFMAVGVAKVWIHVDTRTAGGSIRWTYPQRPLHLPPRPLPAAFRAPGSDS